MPASRPSTSNHVWPGHLQVCAQVMSPSCVVRKRASSLLHSLSPTLFVNLPVTL